MRSNVACVLACGISLSFAAVLRGEGPAEVQKDVEATVRRGPFAPTWESLKAHKDPAWFADAKFAPVTAQRVRLNITEATDGPTIWEFQLFK